MAPLPSPAQVREGLDRFWAAVDTYAKAHGGRFAPAERRDWRKERFDERLSMEYPDPTSLDRLLKSWGWAHPEGDFVPEIDGFSMRGRVEGRDVEFSLGTAMGSVPGRGFGLASRIALPPGIDPLDWTRRNRDGARDLKLLGGATNPGFPPSPIWAARSISLDPPTSIRDLKRRLTGFARDVKALESRP